MRRARMLCIVASLAMFAAADPPALHAQLRPLEPVQWRLLLDDSTRVAVETGASRLIAQRASLAGTTGNLWELGNFSVGWHTGRVVIDISGTVQRVFDETGRFAAAYPYVEAAADGRRNDSGDYRISTVLRLTPKQWPFTGVVRFGTRLPTTDNTTGLDRDGTDFFSTVGGIALRGPFALSGEAGIGIHTTREPQFEQDDLLLYMLRGEYRRWHVIPSVMLLGQAHGTGHSAIRGVENLGEMRLGLRAGDRQWARVEIVHGYETFSPSSGVIVSAGLLM